MPNWPFYRLTVKKSSPDKKANTLQCDTYMRISLPVSCFLPSSTSSSTLLRLAAVVVEHLVQRGKDRGRLLLADAPELVMGAGHQLRRAQPVVADAVFAAHALAAAAHQPAGALAVHDDAGKVLPALVADALQ